MVWVSLEDFISELLEKLQRFSKIYLGIVGPFSRLESDFFEKNHGKGCSVIETPAPCLPPVVM